MRVLVACEYSGRVRDAFIKCGHDAVSCDLLPTDRPGPHYQGDVRDVLSKDWDMVLAFPDCTYLCGSRWHWVKRGRIEADGRPRIEHVHEALAFARMFIDGAETAHIPRRCAENPIGKLSTLVRKPDQIIQPNWFGDDASKATCLWLHGLPPLEQTRYVHPRAVCPDCKSVYQGSQARYAFVKGCACGCEAGRIKARWANQTDSGQNKLAPSDDRWKLRAETYPGIADAMAEQWGSL